MGRREAGKEGTEGGGEGDARKGRESGPDPETTRSLAARGREFRPACASSNSADSPPRLPGSAYCQPAELGRTRARVRTRRVREGVNARTFSGPHINSRRGGHELTEDVRATEELIRD